MARHCPECGFVLTEGANYCQKCGAFVGTREPRDDVTTATYVIDEQTGELRPVDVGDVAAESGALVIRSGGGRVGQSFPLHGERMTIGRSPDTEIFLDDVTVSRDHAVLVRRSGAWYLDDSGLAERHVRQPPPDRLAQARGRRRAPDRQVQADVPGAVDGRDRRPLTEDVPLPAARGRRGAAQVADHRRGLQGAVAGVPGHLDLQDPLPGGPEAADAAAHAGRLPALRADRRVAAAHDPAPAARRVPAAARHPPGAGRRARRRTTTPAPAADAPRRRRRRRARAPRCGG